MADDIKVIIGVDSAPVQRAVQLMNNLESEVRDVEKAEKKGLITRQRAAAETKRLTDQMTRLKQVSAGSAKDFYKFEKALVGSGKAARRNEVAIQQAGYQFQDFVVQVQGGVNPLIAFSQQGSQLAGFFAGPWGAAIGLGIAVLGSFGMALMTSIGTTKKFQDQIKDTTSTLDEYFNLMKSNSGVFSDAFEKNVSGLKLTSEAAKDLLAIARIEAFKGIESLNASLTKSVLSASFFKSQVQDIGNLINQGFGAKIAAELGGKAGQEIRDLYDALIQLRESPTLEGQYEAALKAREIFKQNVDVTGKLTDQQKAFWKEISQTIQQMELLGAAVETNQSKYEDTLGSSEGLTAATDAQNKMFGELVDKADKFLLAVTAAKGDQELLAKIDIASGINAAAIRASELSKEMKDALLTALNLVKLASADNGPVGRGRGKAQGAGSTDTERTLLGMGGEFLPYPEKKTTKSKSGGAKKESSLEKLQAQLKLEQELIGKSEEYARVRQALGESYDKVEPKQIANLENQIRLIEEAKQAEQDRLSIMGTVESSMEEGFMSMIDGTASVGDAFKEMARQIIAELMRVLVVKRMVSGITSFLGFADGGAFSGGSQIQAYADGGVVGGPTFFPMSGGKTGLMGEAGPEAIMPLKRGANGKLGVQVEGNAGGDVNIVQNFSFAANGDDSVKKLIAQAAPQIANMTQKQIMDSRRRGGALKSTFG
jgi:ABC-type transporter Mla subunit MlaD